MDARWQKLSWEGLVAKLEQGEATAFSKCAWGVNAAEELISLGVSYVRGCIRTGGRCRMAKDPETLPRSVIGKTYDYIVYDLLKRLALPVNEDRRRAHTSAEEFFRRIEKGEWEPESEGEDDADAGGLHAAQLVGAAPNRTTPHNIQGY